MGYAVVIVIWILASLFWNTYFHQNWPTQQSHGLFATAKLLVTYSSWTLSCLFRWFRRVSSVQQNTLPSSGSRTR